MDWKDYDQACEVQREIVYKEMQAEIKRLRAELHEAFTLTQAAVYREAERIKERDRARELAVWAVKHDAHAGFRNFHTPQQYAVAWSTGREDKETDSIDCDGTDAGILAALEEAMGRE